MVTECKEIPYSGNFSREKTFVSFAVSEPSAKVFSVKYFGRGDTNCNAQVAYMRVRCACTRAQAKPT